MDELDPVRQVFEADIAQYAAAVEEAAADAQAFAAANEEAKVAASGLRDSAAEAALSVDEMRNRLAETAAAAGITRDEMGKLHDAQGKIVSDSVLTGLALGHERDKALEAAAAYKRLRDAVAEADVAKSGGGLLSMLSGAGGGIQSGGSGIPLIGPLFENPELLLAVIPAIGAAVTEVGALATGLTAAGLGVGSFAALALPAFKSVSGAYQQIEKDHQAYDRALTATAKSNALKHLQQDLAGLDPAERGALEGVQQLTGEYQKLSKAFEPTAFAVFNEGLKIANQLLPYVGQFANAAAPAIEGLLTSFSKGLDSPGFKHFTGFLESLAGPSITAIGSGMAGLAKDVAQLMESFSAKDVANSINIAFRVLGFALSALTVIIKVSMAAWDQLTTDIHTAASAFDTARHAVATAGHDIASAFDTARHAATVAGHDIASAFDTARHGVAQAADGIKNAVVSAVTRVETTVRNDWKLVASWLVNPVATAVYEIRTHTHEIAADFDRLRHETAAILDGARHDTAAVFDGIRHDVAAIVVGIPGDIRKQWDAVRHDAAAFGAGLLHDTAAAFTSLWHSLTSTTSAGAAQVGGFFQKLPGEIIRFLTGLPGQMLTVGENIVLGLIRGIENQASALLNDAMNLARKVEQAFTNPLSILSPSRVMFGHGVNYVQGIIDGIKSAAPQLLATVRGLSGGTASSYAAGAIAQAGGGTSMHVTVPITLQGSVAATASPQYLQGLQATVQEAVLRYDQVNATNGFAPSWGR